MNINFVSFIQTEIKYPTYHVTKKNLNYYLDKRFRNVLFYKFTEIDFIILKW